MGSKSTAIKREMRFEYEETSQLQLGGNSVWGFRC